MARIKSSTLSPGAKHGHHRDDHDFGAARADRMPDVELPKTQRGEAPKARSDKESGGMRDIVDGLYSLAGGRSQNLEALGDLAAYGARLSGYAALAYGSVELLNLARRSMTKYLTGVDPDAEAAKAFQREKADSLNAWEQRSVSLDQPGMREGSGNLSGLASAAGLSLPGGSGSNGSNPMITEGKFGIDRASGSKTLVMGDRNHDGQGGQSVLALSTGHGRETISAYSESVVDGATRKRNFVTELPGGSLGLTEQGFSLAPAADRALQIGERSMRGGALESEVAKGNDNVDVLTVVNERGRVTKEARFANREGQGSVELSDGRAVLSRLDQNGKPMESREVRDPGIRIAPETGIEAVPEGLMRQVSAFSKDPSRFPEGMERTGGDRIMDQARALSAQPLGPNPDLGRPALRRDFGITR